MIFFITFLRALGTCLITNSHYTGVYPTDLIANGGLLGDILFFAVSGYCLTNVKQSFFSWYGKRILRCYTPVIIITVIYMLLGFYSITLNQAFWWYIYPTNYHFVASIVILYVPFYFIMKYNYLKNKIPLIMILIAIVYFAYYLFAYDKSYYHIDAVRQPIIRFLFMECMLLGAHFKLNDAKIRNNFSIVFPVCAVGLFIIYFISKVAFSKINVLSEFQIINQIIIFVLLYFVMKTFAGIDNQLEKLPKIIKNIVNFLANITLEIYVVQSVIIDVLRKIAPFPINWLVLTCTIIFSAFVLHSISKCVINVGEKIIAKFKAT